MRTAKDLARWIVEHGADKPVAPPVENQIPLYLPVAEPVAPKEVEVNYEIDFTL